MGRRLRVCGRWFAGVGGSLGRIALPVEVSLFGGSVLDAAA